MSVLVVGSFITDFVGRCAKAPVAGESVVGKSFNTYPGGKGANQAVACARMGSKTYMAGCVGDDLFGENFINIFKNEGFDTKYIKVAKGASTGASIVTVEDSGQNRIVMTPGANLVYSTKDVDELEEVLNEVSYCVSQAEQTEEVLDYLVEKCKAHNVKFIYNPAPARHISDKTLKGLYLITPNETELGVIIGKEVVTDEEFTSGAKELLAKGVENVVVTLGTRGCLFVNKDETTIIPAYKVKAVDTVGAGDSFTGSLAASLDQGKTLKEALKISNAVGALEVQKNGAIPAMPYKKEVEEFLKNK